jgi:hypothetical protein
MLHDKDSGRLVPVVARMRHGTAEPLEEVAISQTIVFTTVHFLSAKW